MKLRLERVKYDTESLNETIKKLEDKFKSEEVEFDGVLKHCESLERVVKEKDNMIDCLNKDINDLDNRTRQSHMEYTDLYNNHQGILMRHDSICNENNLLREKIATLENEIDNKSHRFEETQLKYNQYEVNYRKKDIEIESFKESFEKMKVRQVEIVNVLELFEQENINLKKLLAEKKLHIEDLVGKIEGLKLEFQDKIMILERDYDEAKTQNKELQNKMDNVLKIKIRALKTKLKEKLDIISELERKYQYEKEKRGLY
jgi:chromosome segregation ATPase